MDMPTSLCGKKYQDALDAMTTDEAQLVSAVSMLKALGVEDQPDIEVTVFPPHVFRWFRFWLERS